MPIIKTEILGSRLEINYEDAIEDADANTLDSLVISTEDLSDSNEENN